MQICSSVAELRTALRDAAGPIAGPIAGRIGLVPTMGALHDGHAALMQRARTECAVVVASIFVNPKQFGDTAELERYPRTPDADAQVARAAGCDVLFCPTPDEIYPPGAEFTLQPGSVAQGFEGAFRPGHFEGVCMVVCKLFHIVGPDRAYFGTKDAQQLAVVRAMVRDLNFLVQIVGVETVRDADGLALSSRNRRLSERGRRDALALSAGLFRARSAFAEGQRDPAVLAKTAASPKTDYEYCACVDPVTFGPPQSGFLIIVAAVVHGVRLIDNLLLTERESSRYA